MALLEQAAINGGLFGPGSRSGLRCPQSQHPAVSVRLFYLLTGESHPHGMAALILARQNPCE